MKTANMAVTLIDSMGSDLSVVNAARVSFDKESSWVEQDENVYVTDYVVETRVNKYLGEPDAKLISYLAKHNHWSPFAHCFASFRIKAPIFVARQLVKHQVGLAWNEVSRRYVDSEPEFFFPDVWRGRPEGSIKQGSSGEVNVLPCMVVGLSDPDYEYEIWPEQTAQLCLAQYNDLLAQGVAPEQARMILPQNTMTEWIWSGSLMAFARVCKQRLDSHAQAETHDVAVLIDAEMSKLFPVSWEALK